MFTRLARLVVAAAAFVIPLPVHAAEPANHSCRTLLTAAPVGTSSCPGARPGALYKAGNGNGCSMGFLFRGSDGNRYVTSAAHCIWAESNVDAPNGKEQTWGPGTGMAVNDINDDTVGRFAFGVWTDERDFSLIRLNPGVQASPAMCYFGGPTGMYTAHASGTVFLKHFGNGQFVSAALPARSGFATDTSDPYWIYAYTAAVPGDSGSGIMTEDGRALGTIDTLGLAIGFGGGTTGISRLDASIAEAQKFMGITLTLQTAPLEPDLVRL